MFAEVLAGLGTCSFNTARKALPISLFKASATCAKQSSMFLSGGIVFEDIPTMIGLLVSIILMILLYVHSEWYVVNTVGILVGSGVIVMLGVSFVPTLIMVFMVAAAIYDAWAVYKSKHMLDLADTMINLNLPILLVAPQDSDYSFRAERTSSWVKN